MKWARSMHRFDEGRTFILLIILGFASHLPAQDSGQAVPADQAMTEETVADALRVTTDAAKLYQFSVGGKNSRTLRLYPESVLRWSNPEAGEVYGNVFVWTDQNRPQVIGSFFQWYSPLTHGSHELHSLSQDPLQGRRGQETIWRSPGPGVLWNRVIDPPTVGDSNAVRLRQGRAIARRFEIQKTDRAGASRRLRMLAQPIYRYGGDQSEIVDGMIFVFVQGTDPEVFLLLETRESGGQSNWHYSLARMNSVKFVATYNGEQVWRTEIWPWSKVKSQNEVYTSVGPFERDGAAQ